MDGRRSSGSTCDDKPTIFRIAYHERLDAPAAPIDNRCHAPVVLHRHGNYVVALLANNVLAGLHYLMGRTDGAGVRRRCARQAATHMATGIPVLPTPDNGDKPSRKALGKRKMTDAQIVMWYVKHARASPLDSDDEDATHKPAALAAVASCPLEMTPAYSSFDLWGDDDEDAWRDEYKECDDCNDFHNNRTAHSNIDVMCVTEDAIVNDLCEPEHDDL